MTLEALLSPRLSLCHLAGSSKKKLLLNIAQAISEQYPDLDSDTVFNQLVARERLGSTGIGEGVAIPHCRLPGCEQPIGVLCTTSPAVDFDAIDRQPVDLLFALLVPEDSEQEHLDTLAEIAALFSDSRVREKLREATTSDDLYALAINSAAAA
ncbi:PTS IIA-like nitrogen regulatory protein PtsN [Microbulbifer hydrolyticus]|uniref:PTS IIA-like nitrogen regulatory protein PtsN n=1 Tax=Microbulbifer hydrolyticus TaxID=48074 RepID=A0A6P1TE01_9GAMM|nr:PTS IIA-like nitrogen regulatory protein PtsN [Microbulbifer hydrolyticus]MBB5212204.1 PTS system nitrogen regulatory IIA component [Microbulbifer hydrolyticus]QHQ39866.1 PTS IIA-like nitrogen regulatory protein PtsN [Microbulbifer hydrolyticus]